MTHNNPHAARGRETGYFITVEGAEGCGKSTAITFIRTWLQTHDFDHITTREPGGTRVAEQLRTLLLHYDEEPIDETAELLMIFAGRAQHLARVIRPALQAGKIVVCDRFTDTTRAYQGGGRGTDMRWIDQLSSVVQKDVQPDLTLLLDLPVATGLQRALERSAGNADRFEREDTAFFERVRNTYLSLAQQQPERFECIDAAEPVAQVHATIARTLQQRLLT